ncbi:MAG TPA: Asp-tRNA(Asn)/Glu-tRNA(Gln) amidotransferase subunit GatB [Candidatus Eisenbacteria bacterium]|nr:Asp-tRNA(Asn)/Glu-tRNA(Gln) amidotransferase subunit GatB [Candidatus Eisenbacteria bacterium]
MAHEAVIGLECHIQLNTRSKMFCGCPAEFGAAPNSNVCPVCLGLPGPLPITNRAAVDAAVRLGLALGCEVRGESVFARKHYFYPDMPKNFQITQYDRPLCEGGALPVRIGDTWRSFDLIRVHAEEDTGKSFHPERHGDRQISRVDFNRAGVPLLELVTQPVFRDPAECAAFLIALRRLVRWLGISEGDMEKGHLRCDANVSIRPAGTEAFGTKTELKNLNSIKGVEKGLTAEIARQEGVVKSGGRIEQATLLYDLDHDKLAIMRTKEHAHDYRYFPEPDLPLLRVDEAWRASARERMPELPWVRAERLVSRWGLPAYDAGILCEQRELADYFEALAAHGEPKLASNWLMTEVLRLLKERNWSLADWTAQVPVSRFAAFLKSVASKELPGPLAKQVVVWLADEPGDVPELLERHGSKVQSSAEDLMPLVRAAIDENPGPVSQYLAGKTATLGFLVGQVMKKSGGQAVPQTVKDMLEAELSRRAPAR